MNKSFLSVLCLIPSILIAADVYFSPNGGIQEQLIRRINHSKTSVDLAVYSFTAGPLAQALADASERGVKIRVIRDISPRLSGGGGE